MNGYAQTNSGGQTFLDAFVRKYNSNGTELWTRQFGTSSDDRAGGISVDASGGVYVAGNTRGTLSSADGVAQISTGMGNDAFVRKYDADGSELWTALRASRDTELRERFPSHVVTKWIGHDDRVA